MKKDLQIPTVRIRGSAAHNCALWSFYYDGIIVSHLVGTVVLAQPCSPKCPRTGRSKNCRPVRSSLLDSFPVGPPDQCEH